jgi:hypothetical protein
LERFVCLCVCVSSKVMQNAPDTIRQEFRTKTTTARIKTARRDEKKAKKRFYAFLLFSLLCIYVFVGITKSGGCVHSNDVQAMVKGGDSGRERRELDGFMRSACVFRCPPVSPVTQERHPVFLVCCFPDRFVCLCMYVCELLVHTLIKCINDHMWKGRKVVVVVGS